MPYYNERIGYRVNALNTANTVKPNEGLVTVYAERKNNEAALGEYGGDAYPLVDECEIRLGNASYRFGIVLVSDGVGNAAYVHPSLEAYLKDRIAEYGVQEDTDTSRLMIFLQDLYGPEIFQPENRRILAYALKCFSSIPADGYFAVDERNWEIKGSQCSMPFYRRDSQSLGSRITCVGLYKTAIEWLRAKQSEKFRSYAQLSAGKIDEGELIKLAEELKKTLEAFAFGDGAQSFRTRTQRASKNGKIMFSHEDAPNTDKRNRYFLAATVAAWFYLYNPNKKENIYAVSVNIGDARTYLLNKEDGVRQISVDDAFPNNNMRGFVHGGQVIKQDSGYCDGSFFARMIRSSLPCALLACSDGIYETVCNVPDPAFGRVTLPSCGDSHDALDILFEKNLLEAVRRSYSFDDFKRELVFTFYAQPRDVRRVLESRVSSGIEAKRDDSGTAAARFFGATPNVPIELFQALRSTDATSLDELWRLLTEKSNEHLRIPCSEPAVTPKEERMQEQRLTYAVGKFREAVLGRLAAMYPQAYESMEKASATEVWGIRQESMWTRPKFKLDSGGILLIVLDRAIRDWEVIHANNGSIPTDWPLHEHVIFDQEMLDALTQIEFEEACKALTAEPPLTEQDLQLRLYEWFQDAFFGTAPQRANNPGFEYYNRQQIWWPDEASRAQKEWMPKLDKVLSEFNKELEAQEAAKHAAEKQKAAASTDPATAASASVTANPNNPDAQKAAPNANPNNPDAQKAAPNAGSDGTND